MATCVPTKSEKNQRLKAKGPEQRSGPFALMDPPDYFTGHFLSSHLLFPS
jgi:hypothetical protein